MQWPFVSRRKFEEALASVRDMRDDYMDAEIPEGHRVDLASYKKGKRDAYRRAVLAFESRML